MKRILLTGIVIVLAIGAFAKQKTPKKLYVKPGSGQGFVAVVNEQTKVDEKEFVAASEEIRKGARFIFKFVKTEAEAKGAAVTVRVVDQAGKPPMTVSPEIGHGEMNVAALVDDLTSEESKKKFILPRARREFMRTVAYAFGAGGSQFPGNIMAAMKIRDLDYCEEFVPVDTLKTIADNGKKLGLKPERAVRYDVACEEGWAPEPKTDEEKQIWKEIHSLPENPIKIKFDPKTDK